MTTKTDTDTSTLSPTATLTGSIVDAADDDDCDSFLAAHDGPRIDPAAFDAFLATVQPYAPKASSPRAVRGRR